MAQAARLNLRMQKELKILTTDPPPGVSIDISDYDNTSSLTSFETSTFSTSDYRTSTIQSRTFSALIIVPAPTRFVCVECGSILPFNHCFRFQI